MPGTHRDHPDDPDQDEKADWIGESGGETIAGDSAMPRHRRVTHHHDGISSKWPPRRRGRSHQSVATANPTLSLVRIGACEVASGSCSPVNFVRFLLSTIYLLRLLE